MSAHQKHYSPGQAKRSLGHYFGGRAASALLGFYVLILLVRAMPVADYGVLVALLALLEVIYLFSGMGLSFMIQRYVPEFRMTLTGPAFRRAILRLSCRRAVYSAIAAALLWTAAEPVFRWFELVPAYSLRTNFLVLVMLGCQLRFLDELLPALLLQGYAQISVLARNFAKLGALAVFHFWATRMSLADAVCVELLSTAFALFISIALLLRYLAREGGQQGPEQDWRVPSRARREARRHYLAQLLSQVYSLNAVKLVISSTLGPSSVALYGFVQSLATMLGNYQPAVLLSSWVRPIVVVRYVGNRDGNGAMDTLSALFKVGLIALCPVIPLFLVFGDAIGNWLSGGKYAQAGKLLSGLTVVVLLQGLHMLLGIATTAFEKTRVVVGATLCCAILSLALWRLVPAFDIAGAQGWLICAELTYILYVAAVLRRSGVWTNALELLRYARLAMVVVGILGAATLAEGIAAKGPFGLSAICALLAIAGWAAGIFCGLFSEAEMQLIAKAVPRRFAKKLGATV